MSGTRSVFAAGLLLAVSAAPALAASPYASIISFGDSLSDVGNVFAATGGLEPASPYYEGRFSNGPIWLDDVASALGLPAPTPSVEGGTDFAWGDATTGFGKTNDASVPNLKQQVSEFLKATHGVAPSDALYTFSIGANDLFATLDDYAQGDISFRTAKRYAREAAQVVAKEAGRLEQAGAADLVLFDVPDLGLTPSIAAEGPAAAAAASYLSWYFDQAVLADLAPVEQKGLKVFDLDTYTLIGDIAADPSAAGFANATDACYVGPVTGGGSVCAEPNTYLFWDGAHPSAHAGELIADRTLSLAAPEPASWALMATGFAALGLAGLRVRRGAAKA